MRFFGYYALHSFINQLRKLFKTWVLVFILVCGLMGGLIGYGAAMLEDTIDENSEPAVIEEIAEPEEDEGPELPISGSALMELIAGGAVLALLCFEAISADKNGSKIFLPADVNLLFPSPMKPQSVLMFRLATQLGTALVASLYILFQIPNLMLNLGLSGWAALGIIVTWFIGILMGKLLQVLLYTVCSTKPQFKQYLSKGIYGCIAAIALSFFLFYKSGSDVLLVSADRFFNAPFTRWIPFWGWLKGLALAMAEQHWGMAAGLLALLTAGCAALVYGIWNINADFYEDAMAKSEETAAIMERAQSEKTSGVAVTKQRKKDRSEKLRRDGLNAGWGASVFFRKTMYNRFRFAHLGFLTKTMETYLAAALGIAAVTRFFAGSTTHVPVVLGLGVLVFFRAMGDPLSEDVGMDFFRLIPESTWAKLFYSLLGGTVSCLMDLLLPMLAASALLMVNPVKLLLWLPVIVSVDFYATTVVTFIDLSVPASIGKTIKQLITIFFIYFGLLPDIAILGFGIALGYTIEAAVGSTALNLFLGILFLSMASVFLSPGGKEVIPAAENVDLKAARKNFSRLGFGILAILVIVTVLQIVLMAVCSIWLPQVFEAEWGIWLLTFAPQYLIGVPVGLLIMRKVPASPPERKNLGWGMGVRFFFISVFMMYGGNLLGNLITGLLGNLASTTVENPLVTYITGSSILYQFIFMVILAPLIEEFLFRRTLIDRMRRYGGKTAVILSALLFGLFHGNLSQFFYAFGLGLVFGYVYLNTGKLRHTIIAHMIINFMGSIFSTELLRRIPDEVMNAGSLASVSFSDLMPLLMFGGYVICLILSALVGFVLLFMSIPELHFPAGSLELPRGTRLRTAYLNAGMILITLASLGMILTTLL